MRLLVCGGRYWSDSLAVESALDRWHAQYPITCLIHGGQRGVDAFAGRWAASHHIPIDCYPADWAKSGRAAGPKRNATMIRRGRPAAVMAFPGGPGTADMVRRAHERGILVFFPLKPRTEG